MKKNVRKYKIFLKSASAFFAVLFFVSGLSAASSTLSESLKDDVTAMITNAKKLPHTIFLIDTSEDMNLFAYSDYVDNCKDGLANIEKAEILCKNAYKQCMNVENNAMCDVNLGCNDVLSKCSTLTDTKTKIASFCSDVAKIYKEPDKSTTVDIDSASALKFVGPWDPSRKYTEDLCFYDWSKDTDGNVLAGTSTAAGNMNTMEDKTDRRDWDCLTDGKGRLYNSDGTLGGQFPESGVSGLWLNWKYATSLDAIKIILADTHSFSFQPRFRGQNDCHKTLFYPTREYEENDENGNVVTRKMCFVNFDTAFKEFPTVEARNEQLAAIKNAVDDLWESVLQMPTAGEKSTDPAADEYAYKNENCTSFSDPSDITLYENPEHPGNPAQPAAVSGDGAACDRCMKWDTSSKSFVDVECTIYNGSAVAARTEDLGAEISNTFNKECCKITECSDSKCRDDDLICKNDSNSCVLGYYSEFDSDPSHCCEDLNCADFGDALSWCVDTDEDDNCVQTCDYCETGSAIGADVYEDSTGPVVILGTPPNAGQSYAPAGDGDTGIPFAVSLKTFNIDSNQLAEILHVKVTVYYGCYDSSAPDTHPTQLFGSQTWGGLEAKECVDSTDPGDNCKIAGKLEGCEESGYVVEAFVNITRDDCKYTSLPLSMQLEYDLGEYRLGEYEFKQVLNGSEPFYQLFRLEASNALTKVYEYECRAAFYHRQSIVVNSSSCPSASSAPALINAQNGNNTVSYCDGGSGEHETIAKDAWGTPTKRVCSWLCRDAETYDDPWKCSAFFYMMDDRALHNGAELACIDKCKFSMGGSAALIAGDDNYTQNNLYIEDCCKCIHSVRNDYLYLEPPTKVKLSDNNTYTCSVSGYQFGTASNGTQTTTSGYMAEIVNGHINEAPGGGSYALQPYTFNGSVYTDTPYNKWYEANSLIVKGEGFVKDTFISAFKTASSAKRDSACIYDILSYGWSGEDCNSCGTGCCAIDLSQQGNECDYPQFWMKVPMSDGGEHIYGAGDFSSSDSIDDFKLAIRNLKAVGGSTLGETLYDVWRYLGGMYALYDPNHITGSDKTPYESPFESQDPTCFSNEAVIISGGQPKFDHNDGIAKIDGLSVSCPSMSSDSNSQVPCVSHIGGDTPSKLHPYYQSDWHQTSLLNVANFAHNVTFWGQDSCRKSTDLKDNALGFTGSCVETANNTGANKAIINRVHTISIGEWALSPLRSVTSSGTGDFLDSSYLKNVSAITGGKYYGLTADNPQASSSGGGTFSNLTDLFSNMMQQQQETDVVSGRPHWTSSLVQPFDVEEKYRGPEAYSAGAVPIDGSVSRFWFGNLKKYMVDDDSQGCSITDDTEYGDCGEWKKQTFPSTDCFGGEDSGADFSGDGSAVDQFKKLMTGGAAYRLKKKLEASTCSELPCFKGTPRNIYYDDGTENNIKKLNTAVTEGSVLFDKFSAINPSVTPDKINRIFDYMAGYDSFKTNDIDRKKVRFSSGSERTVTVQDPINVDFNQGASSEITIRPLLLGAIIHSKPIAVYYENNTNTRIYAGANDGMLHAFDSAGDEVYAYIPSNAFGSILNFGEQQSGIFFNATVDGPITILHIDQSHDGIINGDEKAYLIFGYRRGAKGYTVIDITDPNEPKFVQNLNVDGGYSFGKASIFRKCAGTCSYANDLDYYLAVPGGYDTCHDPTAMSTIQSQNTPACGETPLHGNKFSIYKFNKSTGKFETDSKLVFNAATPEDKMSAYDRSWLVTSFAAVPFVINTSGKAAINTEFVYFSDLSGTVFRVDVRDQNMSNWTAKVVYSQRNDDGSTALKTIPWTAGLGRSYVGANFFPPLERYNPQKNEDDSTMLIPIPMITGNAANPKYVDFDKLVIFYDKKEGDYDSLFSNNYSVNSKGNASMGAGDMTEGQFWNTRGWIAYFGLEKGVTDGEKGITEPLITYNIYGSSNDEKSNAYSIAWNTYIPKKATDCKNFGTSSNYERILNNGKQAFTDLSMTSSSGEWSASNANGKCVLDTPYISLATSVGVIATEDGFDLTFGAGADIFRKREMTVKMNKTYIIKWYELY